MRWIDCATEAPPDDEEVLIFEAFGTHGDIRLGRYNPAASHSKDCVLPNAERRAVWCRTVHGSSLEGVLVVTHFARLIKPAQQPDDGGEARGVLERVIGGHATIEGEVRLLRGLIRGVIES